MKKSHPPAGFIKGEHYHDPRDPGVYYPPAVIGKALRKRAKPNPMIARDPFARQELHRTKLSGSGHVCAWCGQKAKYRYHIESDDGRKSEIGGTFCSVGCMRSYHDLPRQNPAKGKRRKNPGWYIHIQKGGKGPVMLFNGRSFTNQPDDRPYPFASAHAAMYKARALLGKFHNTLRLYKIWVSEQLYGEVHKKRRVNPSSRKLDAAARKLEDFTGHPASQVLRAPARSEETTGLVIGEMDQIDYRAAREGVEGGRVVRYRHKFRKGSRPLLAVSTDGKQLHVVGGQYEFTEAGIEDR